MEIFMKHILIVEDDKDIQELLTSFLSNEGYSTRLANDGLEAITAFHEVNYDLILLDIMLPKLGGYGVCEYIRKTSDVPIVMLTALDSELDQIKGFHYKIDDYITKPFSIHILIRKIEAILRRSISIVENKKILYKDLLVDPDTFTVTVRNQNVLLTPREFGILLTLLENKGRVLSRQQLLDSLWKYDFYGDERVIDTHVKNLRRKLGVDYIETIRGFGYKIGSENQK